ncbi:MAG: HD domain-containing protein [Leptospiraceae bacterium]|nr:HD domain-containing protein [Leptospiraceae bacterium]
MPESREQCFHIQPHPRVIELLNARTWPSSFRISAISLPWLCSGIGRYLVGITDQNYADLRRQVEDGLLPGGLDSVRLRSDHILFVLSSAVQIRLYPDAKLAAKLDLEPTVLGQYAYDTLGQTWVDGPSAQNWTADRPLEGRPDAMERIDTMADTTARRQILLDTIATSAMLDQELAPELTNWVLGTAAELDFKNMPRKQLRRIFKRILIARKPSRAFLLLHQAGILMHILPELARAWDLGQNRHHKYDIFYHSIYSCDAVQVPDPGLRMAALCHDLGKVDTRQVQDGHDPTFHNHEMVSVKHTRSILHRFGLAYDREFAKRVLFLVRNHMFHYTSEWSDKAVRRFMKKVSMAQLQDLIALRLADRKGSGKSSQLPRAILALQAHMETIQAESEQPSVRDLMVNGRDLIAAGIPASPIMGKILDQLLLAVVNQQIPNEKDVLIQQARQYFQEAGVDTGISAADIVQTGATG